MKIVPSDAQLYIGGKKNGIRVRPHLEPVVTIWGERYRRRVWRYPDGRTEGAWLHEDIDPAWAMCFTPEQLVRNFMDRRHDRMGTWWR